MTTIWGPAYDAEIDYRRETLVTAAVPRRGARPRRTRRSRTARSGGAAAARTTFVAGIPATASPRR